MRCAPQPPTPNGAESNLRAVIRGQTIVSSSSPVQEYYSRTPNNIMAQSNATQSFVCAISGQSPISDPVVTPSGYIVSRKLLLTKLAENGGVDPFIVTSLVGGMSSRLDEGSLVELNTGGGSANSFVPPRPPKSTSLPNLLSMLQSEYDIVLLELHDTRASLEETRRELSSALYQNDAAVRVVARLAQERDEARGKLQGYLMTDNTTNNGADEQRNQPSTGANKRGRGQEKETKEGESPSPLDGTTTKKSKKNGRNNDNDGGKDETSNNSSNNTITEKDREAMNDTWNTLTTDRRTKFKLKRTPDEIANNESLLMELATKNKGGHESKKVNLGKSSAKAGILCLSTVKYDFGQDNGGQVEYLLTSGHDKTAIVYDVQSGSIFTTLSGASGVVTALHAMIPHGSYDEGERWMWVVTGSSDGYVRLYCVLFGANFGSSLLIGSVKLNNKTLKEGDDVVPVNVTIHPSSTDDAVRILVASSGGVVELYKFEGDVRDEDTEDWVIDKPSELELLSRLSSNEGEDDIAALKYTAGCMHPDGFIYIAGMSDGRLIVWDMKKQTVAGMLVTEGGGDASTSSFITNIAISENGYHVASSTVGSDGDSTIQIWDLRKLKMIASIKPSVDKVGQIVSLAFDPTAAYLAYTGEISTKICVVKEWDRIICTLPPSKTSGGSKKKGISSSNSGGGGIVWGGKGFGPLEDGGQGKIWLATGCDGERPVRFWGVE